MLLVGADEIPLGYMCGLNRGSKKPKTSSPDRFDLDVWVVVGVGGDDDDDDDDDVGEVDDSSVPRRFCDM